MKIILPLSVTLPRKTKADKVFILNLNVYRNCHHMTLNQAKIAYFTLVEKATFNSFRERIDPPLRFTYTIFPGSGRKFDVANVLPIVQKFTDDALIDMGFIPDDSYKVIPAIDYRFGGVDKEFPRVELEITPFIKDGDVFEIADEVL
jgi:hypothetical protein